MSRRDVRKRVRSLKLQLFCTFPGLAASGAFSWLGECLTARPGAWGDALFRITCAERELFIRILSRKPSLLLVTNKGKKE